MSNDPKLKLFKEDPKNPQELIEQALDAADPNKLEVGTSTDDPKKFVHGNTIVPWEVVPEEHRPVIEAFLKAREGPVTGGKAVRRTDTEINKGVRPRLSPDFPVAIPDFKEAEVMPPPSNPVAPPSPHPKKNGAGEEVRRGLQAAGIKIILADDGVTPPPAPQAVAPAVKTPTLPPDGVIPPPMMLETPAPARQRSGNPEAESTMAPDMGGPPLKPVQPAPLFAHGGEEPEESPTSRLRGGQKPPVPFPVSEGAKEGVKMGDLPPAPSTVATVPDAPVFKAKPMGPAEKKGGGRLFMGAFLVLVGTGAAVALGIVITDVALPALLAQSADPIIPETPPKTVSPDAAPQTVSMTVLNSYRSGSQTCVNVLVSNVGVTKAGTEHVAVCAADADSTPDGRVMAGGEEVTAEMIASGMPGVKSLKDDGYPAGNATAYCDTSVSPENGQPPCELK